MGDYSHDILPQNNFSFFPAVPFFGFVSVTFSIFNGHLPELPQVLPDRSSPNSYNGRIKIADKQSDVFFSDRSRYVATVTNFGGKIGVIGRPHLHSAHWRYTKGCTIATPISEELRVQIW